MSLPADSTSFNLADYFIDRHVREGRGAKVAIGCGESSCTYADLAAQVNRAANGLLQLGLQEEQRVLLLLPDGPEFAVAYFAVMKMGAVAVPTTTAARAADYDYFLSESRARLLIVHSSLFNEVAPLLNSQPYLRHVIVTGEPQAGCLRWDEWLGRQSPEANAADTTGDDIAFWLWTSGSTGRPKAAVHLHRDWMCCCRNYAGEVLGMREDDVTFSSSKLFHAYGLGNGLMFPFFAGASTVLFPGKAQAKPVLQIVQSARPTLFFSVPTLYAQMLQEAESEPYCLDSVRLAVSAAEPLPAEIFRRWQRKFGMEILDGIGSTEALHIYLSARAGKVKPGSTGTAVPGYKLRIVDASDRDVSPGTIGDLLVSGDSIASCYWGRRELTADRMRGKWFFTGDKYSMDDDGYYWYAGRSDDMFRVSGQWLSPAEVESTLIEHDCVLEAAVVAYREENELHTPKAFVVLRPGVTPTPSLCGELQEFVRQRIAPYKYPRRIEF
ncbi:MAG TPA: benzoate-CoA ligase family protein, partial [Terriglobales bacterium]